MLKRAASYVRYLWRITEGFHRAVILRSVLGVIRVGFMLSFVWLSKTAIDCATGRIPAGTGELVLWFALMVGCLLSNVAITQTVNYMETRASVRMNNRLNLRLFNELMALPLVHGQQGFHSGDMLDRLTVDVRTVTRFALSQLPSMAVMGVQLAASFLFLAWLNPYLALAPVIIMPLCLLAGKMYFRRNRRLTAEMRESESDMHVSIQEGLKHRIVLKSLECDEELNHRLGFIQQKLDSTNKEQAKLSIIGATTARIGFILGYLTAFGWGIFSLKSGAITFGTMTAFIQLVSRIQNPIAGISGYLPSFVATSVAIDRLREIDLRMPGSGEAREGKMLQRAGVRVSNLSFGYESDGNDVLSHFSHDFRPGSRTMIVGSTGAGKTTLIKLLLGLLSPGAGSIEIYAEGERQQVSSATLCNFVYVPQGNSLLHGTIRDNLLLAAPHSSDGRLYEALHTAAADFVKELPQGLDTSCDEAGGGLSEGQAQRIAIARALLRPGSILLLDEFNSALDTSTAATLMQRLSDSCPDSTIIIIAHHQSAIAPYCDEVLHIECASPRP